MRPLVQSWKLLRAWLYIALQPTAIFGAAIVAGIWVIFTYQVSVEKTRALDAAIERGRILVRLFEDTTVRLLKGVDQRLLFIRMAYEENPSQFNLTRLADRANVLNDVISDINIIGPDGYLRARTGYAGPPVNLGDREHFLVHVNAKTDDLFISKPIKLRTTGRSSARGQTVIVLSRRLRNPDGSFAGTTSASVDLSLAEKFYHDVKLGERSGVLLRGLDGVVRSSYGFPAPADTASERLAESLSRASEGYHWITGRSDNIKRLASYRIVTGYPLVASVGMTESSIFADYQWHRTIYISVAIFMTLLVMIAVVVGLRRQLALRAALELSVTRGRERDLALSTMSQLVHYDTLSGLANRTLFKRQLDEKVARLKRYGTGFAVAMIDLDKFKAVNDTLGHQAGDELLKQVATRIRETIREVDVPARLGGDEFALLISPGDGFLLDGVETLAARLIDTVGATYVIEGQDVIIGCSIGIALAPEDGKSGDELLKNADFALYKSKASGRNCFHFYHHDMKAEADRRNALEGDLRQAIWRNEFELFYQPIVDIKTLQIKVMEALVRWRHPTRGLICPDDFIPLAERTGLIGHLGEWILMQACSDAGGMPDHISVAVNLSPVQFARSNVVDSVIMALVQSQLPAERLELEITEGVLLTENQHNTEVLRQLKNIGVAISLDDFGVGYSSLSYLTSFPFDRVKIDRSFVEKLDRPETLAVLKSIEQLSKTLNLTTCVEGVETVAQLRQVRTLDVELCQGKLFSMPKPVSELEFEDLALQRALNAA